MIVDYESVISDLQEMKNELEMVFDKGLPLRIGKASFAYEDSVCLFAYVRDISKNLIESIYMLRRMEQIETERDEKQSSERQTADENKEGGDRR